LKALNTTYVSFDVTNTSRLDFALVLINTSRLDFALNQRECGRGEHVCVYLCVVITIGTDEAVSSSVLQRRAWVEDPASVDSTRLVVGAAPSRTISGRRKEMGSSSTAWLFSCDEHSMWGVEGKRWPDLELMEGLGRGAAIGPAPSRTISGQRWEMGSSRAAGPVSWIGRSVWASRSRGPPDLEHVKVGADGELTGR
jgi:hypothetical protein